VKQFLEQGSTMPSIPSVGGARKDTVSVAALVVNEDADMVYCQPAIKVCHQWVVAPDQFLLFLGAAQVPGASGVSGQLLQAVGDGHPKAQRQEEEEGLRNKSVA
jgi:hypothetical protein